MSAAVKGKPKASTVEGIIAPTPIRKISFKFDEELLSSSPERRLASGRVTYSPKQAERVVESTVPQREAPPEVQPQQIANVSGLPADQPPRVPYALPPQPYYFYYPVFFGMNGYAPPINYYYGFRAPAQPQLLSHQWLETSAKVAYISITSTGKPVWHPS
jgi:hypothetical protein